MLSVLIGGINVSRATKSSKSSEEVASAIKAAAIKAVGGCVLDDEVNANS